MNAVECVSVTKIYGHVRAIADLSLSIEPNKIIGIIGPNGAGKTTLLKLIAGALKASRGEISVFGEKPFNNLTVSANSIFVDDRMSFPPTLSLDDILGIAAGVYANWDKSLARALIGYFELDTSKSHARLSRGQQSTFNVILGLAARCPLTIFDEPTLGMDLGVRRDFYRALLKDYMQHPRSVLFSSHMLQEAEDLLEEVVLLRNGQKVLHVPLPQLKEYAVGLAGSNRALAAVVPACEVIHTRQIGDDYTYTVVKNNLTERELHQARLNGVGITAVAMADLCMYLTAPRKGVIDDVYNQT